MNRDARRCPQIVVYGPNEDAPDHMTYAAAMVPDARPGSSWVTTGHSAEGVCMALEAMWRKQYPADTKRVTKAVVEAALESADDLV